MSQRYDFKSYWQACLSSLCVYDSRGGKIHKKQAEIYRLYGRRWELEFLWIAGVQQRIKECDINTQKEKIREMCRQILVIAPRNNIALDYLKRLQKMPQ